MKKKKAKPPVKPASAKPAGTELARKQAQVEAHFRQAEASRANGQDLQAMDSYRQALALAPDFFPALNNLAMSLISLGRFAEAEQYLRRALALDASSAPVHINIGIVLKQSGQALAAEASLRQALSLEPGSITGWYNLGNLLREQGKPADAIACLERVLALAPDHADTHHSLGLAYWDMAQLDRAVDSYLNAIRLNPHDAAFFNNLGNALTRQGKLDIAVDAFKQSIALDPAHGPAYLNLASAQRDLGLFEPALASYRRALQCRPGWIEAQQGILFLMSSQGASTEGDYLHEVGKFGQMVEQLVQGQAFTDWPPRRAGAPLRVGMVSGDLHSHPVAYFLEGVLGHLPALGVEVKLYSTTALQDATTARLQSLVAGWRSLVGLSDAAAAARIHADGMDVLIDLSGHTYKNRLAMFGWRPAPVQVSWLGYFATTGLRQIDAILVDQVGVPAGREGAFTERLCYLPDTRLCFNQPASAPAVAPLPALAKGHLTFGCFQHHAKVSDRQLGLWARVLDAVPGAKLRWQCRQFADARCVELTAKRLEACGIGLERAQLFGHVDYPQYLAAHAEVDMILDTSPYPGGTTTCEALWMGVPTVTLAGASMLSRQGASLLTAAGLGDWVADSESAYIALAVRAAGDVAALARLRAGLRQQVTPSPLFSRYRFAVNLHAALQDLARKA